MVQPGYGGGLDTPQTNIGDATYLSRQPDFDISQEASFQSPSKDANLLQQMRNGGRPNLRTPRGTRAPFGDRRNLPAGLGGAEFTPLLKSATRNSARRHGPGKENGLATPAFLGRIDEDMTPVPAGESSVYGASRNVSYSESTPLPMADTSSVASTPMIMRRRGADGKGPLEDGNQLSLREQENVIDRIEKENFGLKLKIHFLEDALRKAGPGFSEAALRENTELKVDKVTMQRELQRYKKHLTSAEKELESYRLQILEVQEKAQKRFADENQRAELERLRQELEEKDADIEQLRRSIEQEQNDHDNAEKLQDDIADLEADVREKDRLLGEHEDQLDELRLKLEEAEDENKDRQRRILELEQNAQQSGELDDAKDTIEELEATVRKLEQYVDDLKEKLQNATSERDRAQGDLDELQEEMSNKSMVTKGLSRQVEEKISRLQHDLEKSREDYSTLEKEQEASHRVADDLNAEVKELRQERDSSERVRQSLATKLEELQGDLNAKSDENAVLQTRHDALASKSASLQREVDSLQQDIKDLEGRLERERQHALDIERDVQNQYKDEVDRLNDEISDLQAEVRERDNLYDNDSEKWETEQRNLESERNRAEERADGLQKTIDKLREVEGSLSSKETRLQEAMQSESERHKKEEAILQRQIEELQQNLGSRQDMLEQLRSELSAASDELSRSQRDYKSQLEKVEALEDEVEILQATIDEESEKANHEIERARREKESLEAELNILREAAEDGRASTAAKNTNDNVSFVRSQLAGAAGSLTKATKENQALQDQLANINIELHSLRASLAEVTAERDELHSELQRANTRDGDPFRVDQERIELRTAKTRLDGEVRRLKEDNKVLTEQRVAIEKVLDDEIEKAATEEERLSQEILQLQARIRQSSDNQALTSARRTVRELERRIEDLQNQLAASHIPGAGNSGEGNSELSLIRRDLTAARAKELDLLQREASQKDVVKSLKRQISELERKAHDAEVSRLMFSPPSAGGSAQTSEVSELRNQLSSAYQTVNELKKSLREADRKTSALSHEMEARIEEVEEQRTAMEQALEDAQLAADEAAATYDLTLNKYRHKLEKYKREREELASALRDQQNEQHTNHSGGSEMSLEERRDLHAMLRESQTAADKLDREVREQREALEELMANDSNMRKKLERARSERAAYRASAEKLQRDVKALKSAKQAAEAAAAATDAEWELVHVPRAKQRHGGGGGGVADTDAIIRAAEAAEQRHAKEIRGMCMQLEWMQARWERESRLRADAAYAKRYLLLELQVRDTWLVFDPPCSYRHDPNLHTPSTFFCFVIHATEANCHSFPPK
jgi:chromosome segregation ATPase